MSTGVRWFLGLSCVMVALASAASEPVAESATDETTPSTSSTGSGAGAELSPDREPYRYSLLSSTTPQILFARSLQQTQVWLRNEGSDTWTSEDSYHVSYRWFDRNDQLLYRPDLPQPKEAVSARSHIQRSVAPGDQIEVNAFVRAPLSAGVYRLRWDVVREGVTWISDRDPSPAGPVTVIVLPPLIDCLRFGPLILVVLALLWHRALGELRPWRVPARLRGPGVRRAARTFGLLLIMAASVAASTWIRGDRARPTVMGDEAIYTYKARNFATYGSYYAPPETPDTLHLSAPLYSLVLSPLFVSVDDPDVSFPWILLLNALLHASMVLPAFKIAERGFPSMKWPIAIAVGLWTIPAGYSMSIMSEALFVPLFLWVGYLYGRATETDHWARHVIVGLAASALLLTRFNGVAIVVVLAIATVVSWQDGRLRRATRSELVHRVPMALLPALAWAALRMIQGRFESTNLHSIYSYAAKGLVQIELGSFDLFDYLGLWLHLLSYLYLATFGLILLLPVPLVVRTFLGTRDEDRPVTRRSSLLPLRAFWLLAALAMMAAATLYMFTHLGSGRVRFLMYGRHVDMLVPVVVIYALGVVAVRPRIARLWQWLAVTAACFGVGLMLLLRTPSIGDTRVIAIGATWFKAFMEQQSVALPWAVVLCTAVVVGVLVPIRNPIRLLAVGATILWLNLFNTELVNVSHRFYETWAREDWDHIRAIRDSGGQVYYMLHPALRKPQPESPFQVFSAQYYLYDRVEEIGRFEELDPKLDYVAFGQEFVPATTFLAMQTQTSEAPSPGPRP